MLTGGLLLVIALVVMVNRFIDKDYLVEQIEQSINSKVTIGDVDVSIFSSPARLTLKDVCLSAKPGGERGGDAEVKVESVELGVTLWSLLSRKLEVTNMTVNGASVTGTIYKDGGSSLKLLFESPDKKKHDKQKRVASDSPKHPKHKSKRQHVHEPKNSASEGGGFNAFDHHDFVASLGGFFLKNSSADITIEKSRLRIRASDLNLSLDALEIDPMRLQDTDSAKLSISGKLQLDSTEGWKYGYFDIRGQAESRLFNVETGDLQPDAEGAIDLGDDSWLNTRIPVITEAWKKLDKLEKIGIRIAPLPERATFGRSQSVAVHYQNRKITIRESLSLWLADWEIAALKDSWLQTETDQHVIVAELLASESASEKLYGLILSTVNYLPRDVREDLMQDMTKNLFRENRFLVRVKSKGELSHPKIRLVDGIPDFGKSAEKAGKRLLKEKAGGLLKGLFGN